MHKLKKKKKKRTSSELGKVTNFKEFFFFFFFSGWTMRLVGLWIPYIQLGPLAVKARSINHRTIRGFLGTFVFKPTESSNSSVRVTIIPLLCNLRISLSSSPLLVFMMPLPSQSWFKLVPTSLLDWLLLNKVSLLHWDYTLRLSWIHPLSVSEVRLLWNFKFQFIWSGKLVT